MSGNAFTIVLAFCDENNDLSGSNMQHQEFATYHLEHLHFLYQKSEGDDSKVSKHIFSVCSMGLMDFIEIQGNFLWPLYLAHIYFLSLGRQGCY